MRKAMILAAGEGTRLRPLTLDRPKPVLPVGGRPLLEHTIRWLHHHGFDRLAINLHYRPGAVMEVLGDGHALGVQITYSVEEAILGTAGGMKRLAPFLDEAFVLVYGDVLTDLDLGALVQAHCRATPVPHMTMSLYRVPNPAECGIVELGETMRVVQFVEKPAPGKVFSDLANAGVLVVDPPLLEHVPEGVYYDVGHDWLPCLLARGIPVFGWPLPEGAFLLDIGSLEKYGQAQVAWPTRAARRFLPEKLGGTERSWGSMPEDSVRGRAASGYITGLKACLDALPMERVVALTGHLERAYREDRQVFIIGNGGSASTASHMACDLAKNALLPKEGTARRPFRVMSLTDNIAWITALANDLGYHSIFAEQLRVLMRPGDLVLAISGSGNSPNIVEGVRYARANGAYVVGILGFDGGLVKDLVDDCIIVRSRNYGHVEDLHMVLDHLVTAYFQEWVRD